MDLPKRTPGWSVALPGWLAVAQSLLKRGRLTALSDSLAQSCRAWANAGETIAPREIAQAAEAVAGFRCDAYTYAEDCFDSDEESIFYHQVLVDAGLEHVRSWMCCQPSLGMLTGNPDVSHRRADFAVSHPLHPTIQLVIEIDGQQHQSSIEDDQQRDQLLATAGWRVRRIPAAEVQLGAGKALDALKAELGQIKASTFADLSPAGKWLLLCKRAHQLQMACLEWITRDRSLITSDSPASVAVHPDDVLESVPGGANLFVDAVLEDLTSMLRDIAATRGEPPPAGFRRDETANIQLSFSSANGELSSDVGHVRDAYLPMVLAARLPKGVSTQVSEPDVAAISRLFTRVFGFTSFREGQLEAILRALRGDDTIVLLPTGSGKSVTFQLAALLRSGVCFAIDPIVSLIDDQVENLTNQGIDRCSKLTGSQTIDDKELVLSQIGQGETLFCFVSPERFQNSSFRSTLGALTANTSVGLVAIDEAHCVSEWGHSFRSAYLNLADNIRRLCRSAGKSPPIMALTGTASHSVLKDIQRELGIARHESIITPQTFDRPELSFDVHRCTSSEKRDKVAGVLEDVAQRFGTDRQTLFRTRGSETTAGLIFCPFVNGPMGVSQVRKDLSDVVGAPLGIYCGTPPKGVARVGWDRQKADTARAFKRNEIAALVCTNAFGMGIDKPNIRYTIHVNLPASVESYYQEAGRAGRDRSPARCIIVYSNDYPERSAQLLDPTTPIDRVRELCSQISFNSADDISRVLYFHNQQFRGKQDEIAEASSLLSMLGDLDQPGEVTIPYLEDERESGAGVEHASRSTSSVPNGESVERAVHRLLVLGVIRDYTKDWNAQTLTLQLARLDRSQLLDRYYAYIAAYQRQRAVAERRRMATWSEEALPQFAEKLVAAMIEFVYEVIEAGRRRNLYELVRLLDRASDGEELRVGILQVLQQSRFSESLASLVSAEAGGLASVVPLIDDIRSTLDAAEVRGECGRLLASYPDLPGLLLVRAASEALAGDGDTRVVEANSLAAIEHASQKYDISDHEVLSFAILCAASLQDNRPQAAEAMLRGAVTGTTDTRAAIRQILRDLPHASQGPYPGWLLASLGEAVSSFRMMINE
jgi:ATP-dependent DNA helicase RecQ